MSDINLPSAIGSGKEYTVANNNGGDIDLVADITGDADNIINVASMTMLDGESLCVVDYKADNWIII